MALYQIFVKNKVQKDGMCIQLGMSVQVATVNNGDPFQNNLQLVQDAFMRIYGVDLKRMNALNNVNFVAVKIGE